MLSKVYSAATHGINAFVVVVETHIENQVPAFVVVGLPDNAVKESRERVTAAIKNSSQPWPIKRIVVNLAPADIKKEGSAFDLPLAVGILHATGTLGDLELDDTILLGELALDGSLRPIHGALSIALEARERGYKRILLPAANAREAAMVTGIDVYPCVNLTEVLDLLKGGRSF